jgi:hypothetical protein
VSKRAWVGVLEAGNGRDKGRRQWGKKVNSGLGVSPGFKGAAKTRPVGLGVRVVGRRVGGSGPTPGQQHGLQGHEQSREAGRKASIESKRRARAGGRRPL